MKKIRPNYIDLGFAEHMGPQLRQLVERQLSQDLKFYEVDQDVVRFDWSDSCVEGHRTTFLDGEVQNVSGVAVFNSEENLIAEGWMEFVHEEDFFLAYWQFVTTWDINGNTLKSKDANGIPHHVWKQIPDGIKPLVEKNRMQEPARLP
jgi:hypothetical protein